MRSRFFSITLPGEGKNAAGLFPCLRYVARCPEAMPQTAETVLHNITDMSSSDIIAR